MIHYHGTPITPRSALQKLAGKNFCVSYAHPADADWCAAHGQSVMWDNGAFTLRNKGGLDPVAFAKWVEPRLGHPHWAVVPDVINGTIEDQRAISADWPHPKELSAPVWHMHLDIEWLLELADKWPRICFGSSSQYWQVGSERWARRADLAFNELERRGLRPWVHMLRGLALCGDQWPFASADSTNVALNFKGSKSRGTPSICPERMARRIDAVQSPIHWTIRPEQAHDLFRQDAAPRRGSRGKAGEGVRGFGGY